jgi:succinyl-diaminopimelate desuccinylase
MSREATFENALAFAQDLIRIPSMPGREERIARRVAEEMEALDFADVRIDEIGNAVGVISGAGAAPAVMLSCHLDMVAEGDHDQWEHPPFAGLVEGGYLHGRGAMDIKGPLALQTYAAASMRGRAQGDVIVAHTVLEERGGWGMQRLVESGSVQPGAVIIGESTHGDIAIGHRGRAEIEIVIRGVAGHASAPERASNVLDLVPAALEAIARLNDDDTVDPVLGKASAVATQVDVRPESRNVIPDEAIVAIDWRVLPGPTAEALVQTVEQALLRALGSVPEPYSVEVRSARERQTTFTGLAEDRRMYSPGFLLDPEHPIVSAAAQAVGKRSGEPGPATVRPWTFATDGGWTCGVHGIPSLGFAPGEERYAHTNRERLDVDEARWAYAKYPDLIQAIQGAL